MKTDYSTCLLCRNQQKASQLAKIHEENSEVAFRIFLISGIQVIDSQNHPALICDQCVKDLNIAHSIRDKCLEADEHLRSLVPKGFFSSCQKLLGIENQETKEEMLDSPELTEADHESDTFKELPTMDDLKDEDDSSDYFQEENEVIESLDDCKEIADKVKSKKYVRKTFFCSHCPKSFKKRIRLAEHELLKHGVPDPTNMVACDICGKKKHTIYQMRQHIKLHFKFQKYICKVCGLGRSTVSALSAHEKTHQSQSFTCDVCHKVYKSKGSLKMHVASIHENSLSGTCPHCPYTSNWKYGLKVHIKEVHIKERNFCCKLCDKTFIRKKELVRHTRRHTGEKPYKCDNNGCPKGYCDLKSKRFHMTRCLKAPRLSTD